MTSLDRALVALIDALFEQQRIEWEEEKGLASSSALETRKNIRNWQWREINEAKLQSMLAEITTRPLDFASEKLVMFLPPFQKEERSFVPAMSLYFDAEKRCLQIRVVMVEQAENGIPHGLGFRIESPTSTCNRDNQGRTSIHDFYHIQLITNMGYGPNLGLPDWLPCKQPSFPLWAINPVDALLNLILTLYGAKYYKDFLRKHGASLVGAMSKEFQQLNQRLRQN